MLIQGWTFNNFFSLQGWRLFEVGANSRLSAYLNYKIINILKELKFDAKFSEDYGLETIIRICLQLTMYRQIANFL